MFLCVTLHTIITALQATPALILIISTLNGYVALLYACMTVCTCKRNADMDMSPAVVGYYIVPTCILCS